MYRNYFEAIRWMTRVQFLAEVGVFLFTTIFRPALECTQPMGTGDSFPQR
jgi:hypothetical protein